MFNKFSIFNFQFSIIIIALSAIMIACSSDDSDDSGDDPAVPAQRTVIAFFDGNNNLSSELREDIVEMENGSKSLSSTTNLIVFANIRGDSAYVAEVVNGKKKKVRMWPKNFISTNPDNMLSVMQWIVEKYPAYEYGIIFGGHGTGSMVNIDEKNDTIPTTLHPAYAYGWDYNNNSTQTPRWWITSQTLATVISHLPHMKFIFFDCCLMQDINVACQLRKYTDYLIAPVCETPAKGAPYESIVPILSTSDPEEMCDKLLTIYRNNSSICISALRSYAVDNLQFTATRALGEIHANLEANSDVVSYDNVIYYYRDNPSDPTSPPALYDLKSFLYEQNKKGYLCDDTYQAFLDALGQCVFSSRMATQWVQNSNIRFTDFSVTPDNYGALSITKKAIEE